MLVLKKVTLQDELDEAAEPATAKRNALTSAIARKYGLLTTNTSQNETITELPPRGISGKTNKTSDSSSHTRLNNSGNENGRLSSIGQCFPIGELLPAVDSSIRNSMPVRHYRSTEHGGKENVDKTMAITGKERMIPYEDNIIMMKEGVEMLRIRDRTETVSYIQLS